MSNFEHSRQEHPEEQDPGIEIVDLEPSESTDTLDKIKRDLLARVEKKHLARPFLLKQGKVQLAALWGVVLVGLIVVLSASGMFSFLLSHLTHPSASPSSDVLLLEQNTLRCLVDTAWSPDNQHRAVLGYGGIASKGRVGTCLVSSTCTMDILLNSWRRSILTLPFCPHSTSHGSSLLANKPRH